MISSNGWALSSSRRRLFRSLRWPVSLIPLSPNRRKWFENADVVVQSAQENEKAADQFSLFGEEPSNEVPIKEVAPWSDRTRMEKEQYVLGLLFLGSSRWKPISRNSSVISELLWQVPNLRIPGEYLVAGMYLGLRTAPRQGRFSFVTLHLATPDGPVDYSVKNQYFEQERVPNQRDSQRARLWSWNLKSLTVRRAGRPGQVPGAFYPLYELRHRQKAHIVIRPAEEARSERARTSDLGRADDASRRKQFAWTLSSLTTAVSGYACPCPYKAAADWTLVRDLEDSLRFSRLKWLTACNFSLPN